MSKPHILITLPYAGGTSLLFKDWHSKLDFFDVLNIDYPGHWIRRKEKLSKTFKDLEDDTINTVFQRIRSDCDVFLFGHSMGAILAWHIANSLIAQKVNIKGLFLSGSASPFSFPRQNIEDISEKKLLELIGYNSDESSEMNTEKFKSMILPIIRNDLKVLHQYSYDNTVCNVESVIYYGVEDPYTDVSELRRWQNCTRVTRFIGFQGDHMFLRRKKCANSILEDINNYAQRT